jgi:hypothetical protein
MGDFQIKLSSSFRDARSSRAGPESILPAVVMDSGLARKGLAPRNDGLFILIACGFKNKKRILLPILPQPERILHNPQADLIAE